MSTGVAADNNADPSPHVPLHGQAPSMERAPLPGIPLSRVVAVELRKMLDTRSGFWLTISIAITATLATAAVVVFGSAEDLTYDTFAAAVGVPMAVLLPVIAILSVTSEWSQRSGLTTFAMVPSRGRVILAKALATVLVGVLSMLVAAAVGAFGNLLGTRLAATDTTWDLSVTRLSLVTLAQVLGMMVGFALGVLLRNSAAAIVTYFVYAFVAPSLFAVLGTYQEWFRDIHPYVDFNNSSTQLYGTVPDTTLWAQIAVSGLIWLGLPLAAGLITLKRAEVR